MISRPVAVLASFLAALIMWSLAGPAEGAPLRRKGEVSAESATNPNPDENDLLLPMPCNLAMAFRVAALPVDGRLRDLEVSFGVDDETRGYLDGRRRTFLGASLSLDNLPPKLRPTAAKALEGSSPDQIYLVGKYELTVAQWNAVMEEGCPALSADGALPKTSVSWYQAMAFVAKYMAWLLKNSPQSLPSYAGDPSGVGVVRLPTEDEWEYAARGGHAVSTDSIRVEPFFPIPPGESRRKYGLFRDEAANPETKPGAVGRWRPNPLGLYDTAGNVAEMTQTSFNLTVRGRLHGSAGGFVRKGGSFREVGDQVLPGRRQEAALMIQDGPSSSADLGLRLVVSGVNLPQGERREEMLREWEESGGTQFEFAGLDPLAKIDALIESAQDEEQRAAYESLKADLKDCNILAARENESAARNLSRSLVYAAYSIRNMGLRRNVALHRVRRVQDALEQLQGYENETPDTQKAIAEAAERGRARLGRALREVEELEAALDNLHTYYGELLSKLDGYDPYVMDRQLNLVRQDIKGADLYSREMRFCLQNVAQDVDRYKFGDKRPSSLDALIGESD
ncbi:MAG: formylglycine-generating enzyme family protein [Deltaproteobacteria bacterium]|jgi:hypothetical protein|nr:formylglycine-generating enzyme family protein [Deltaproteobacteria bacterium]